MATRILLFVPAIVILLHIKRHPSGSRDKVVVKIVSVWICLDLTVQEGAFDIAPRRPLGRSRRLLILWHGNSSSKNETISSREIMDVSMEEG